MKAMNNMATAKAKNTSSKITEPVVEKKKKRRRRVSKPKVVVPEIELTPEEAALAEAAKILADEDAAKKKAARMYFNANTQAAICAYQTCVDRKEHNRLYEKEIMPAFEKLSENLINIHKFTSLHDTYDDLKNDCVNFLFETIHKFDGARGTNAFSYFNVVAKNWLIIRTKQKAQRVKRTVSLDDPDALNALETQMVDEHCIVQSAEVLMENDSLAGGILKLLYEIRSKAKTENELSCINSIITIFENVEDIELFEILYLLVFSTPDEKQS